MPKKASHLFRKMDATIDPTTTSNEISVVTNVDQAVSSWANIIEFDVTLTPDIGVFPLYVEYRTVTSGPGDWAKATSFDRGTGSGYICYPKGELLALASSGFYEVCDPDHEVQIRFLAADGYQIEQKTIQLTVLADEGGWYTGVKGWGASLAVVDPGTDALTLEVLGKGPQASQKHSFLYGTVEGTALVRVWHSAPTWDDSVSPRTAVEAPDAQYSVSLAHLGGGQDRYTGTVNIPRNAGGYWIQVQVSWFDVDPRCQPESRHETGLEWVINAPDNDNPPPAPTTLSAGISSSDTIITVGTTSGLTAGDSIRIDRETMVIDSVDTGTQLTVTRGTNAVAHLAAADVTPISPGIPVIPIQRYAAP